MLKTLYPFTLRRNARLVTLTDFSGVAAGAQARRIPMNRSVGARTRHSR